MHEIAETIAERIMGGLLSKQVTKQELPNKFGQLPPNA